MIRSPLKGHRKEFCRVTFTLKHRNVCIPSDPYEHLICLIAHLCLCDTLLLPLSKGSVKWTPNSHIHNFKLHSLTFQKMHNNWSQHSLHTMPCMNFEMTTSCCISLIVASIPAWPFISSALTFVIDAPICIFVSCQERLYFLLCHFLTW